MERFASNLSRFVVGFSVDADFQINDFVHIPVATTAFPHETFPPLQRIFPTVLRRCVGELFSQV